MNPSPLGPANGKAALDEGGFFVPPGPRRFGPSARALGQRRALLGALKALAFGGACLVAIAWPAELLPLELAKWLLVAVLGWGLWTARGTWLLRPLLERELLLQEVALELKRGAFKRLVVFEGLRHIQVIQGPGPRVISLRLDLDDDSVALRDLEGLDEVLGALAAAKDPRTMIEVEERRLDWGEPLPWAGVAAATGAWVWLIWLFLRS